MDQGAPAWSTGPVHTSRRSAARKARGQNPMVISGAVVIELWTVQ